MGEEPYFIDAISDIFENTILNENEKEFNQTILYGGDTDILRVIATAKRFPMMSPFQVVVVREAQLLRDLTERGKEDPEKQKHPFLSYIENPQKLTILVFCYKYKTLDKRT